MKSSRQDRRGHWPAGKRRNQDAGNWERTRRAVAAIILDHHKRGTRSMRGLAAYVGASDASVRRWVSGEDRPGPDVQALLAEWVRLQRKAIRQESKPSASATNQS